MRISQKPGVQSTLILSRDNGAIVRTTGLISSSSSANPNSTLPASNETAPDPYTNNKKESGILSAEDVASKVWTFLTAAGSLVEGMYEEDEVKLLRLRTKKNELVIIPGECVNVYCRSSSNKCRLQVRAGPSSRYPASMSISQELTSAAR